jgi:bifunctional UDP-N-acetylglucosamine pyrophosphorylase/glucosamine-1-phosphate N-acetyltransferase
MIRVVIMAAGKGKRMGSDDLPKVLRRLADRPLVSYVLDAVAESAVDAKPVLVVGYLADQVRAVCGENCEYVYQEKLLGTGDAVKSARPLLEDQAEAVVVLNGDNPLVTGRTIRKIVDMHLAAGATLTMGTVTVPDFDDWRVSFSDFGRVKRDAAGTLLSIVETKDAAPEEKAIKELNPSFFCFRAEWLWPALETLNRNNVQGEYYLTSLVAKAIDEGEAVVTVPVPPEEAVGVNTPEQLALAETLLLKRASKHRE